MNANRGALSSTQVQHLLKPIHPSRVLSDGKGHSHVSQQDITAHLIRMFGFGNFDIEVMNIEQIFETSEVKTNRSGKEYVAWDVAYRALVQLTIRNEDGVPVARYENGSIGSAQSQPSRADAHDLAYKSAISLSIKRAAIALGDQFGLSLYNKGQTKPLVIRTIVGVDEIHDDLQADIPQQVSLGNDEIDTSEPVEAPTEVKTTLIPDGFLDRVENAVAVSELELLWSEAYDGGFTDEVRPQFTARKKALNG